MSDSETDDPSALRKVVRTVRPPSRGRRDEEMDVVGWGIALAVVIVLVPLLPFLVVVWLVSKVLERADPRSGIARPRRRPATGPYAYCVRVSTRANGDPAPRSLARS